MNNNYRGTDCGEKTADYEEKTVGQRIVELSREKAVTYYRIADLADIPMSTIMNLISGRINNPTLVTLQGICRGLEVSLKDFFAEM